VTGGLASGTRVRVKALFPPGHCRTPFYTRGRVGVVLGLADREPDPETAAYGRQGRSLAVYRVAFAASELWPGYRSSSDRVVVDLFETWLDSEAGA
jgi:nitrile hydratase